ncbi:DNA cytosine methyltransferase, partial [Helcococcus bovis]|uniref:DNA cytosine methyltransferase n=1 Tax=Helcococcus bovis TaxID=3153252 RepID=UPI0038B71FC9
MSNFKFIDLFAGIGGFRLALESLGGECVFSCEIDSHAKKMYESNFNDTPFSDITELNGEDIPDFDVLCAGFPCQSFSVAGFQKGFEDSTRGTLFFDICRILKIKKPKAFILENVKNLSTHDKGNTLFVMLKSLAELGYATSYKVLNAKDFGVPQNRERIIIVGSLEGKIFDFEKLKLNKVHSMESFLDVSGDFEILKKEEYTLISKEYVKRQKSDLIFVGYRNKKIRTKGTREGTKHLSRVHKQPNRIYSTKGVHPTIASQEQSGRYFIFDGKACRKLTLNECFRFFGFPENLKKIGIRSKLYERIGNSVCIPMIKQVMEQILNQIFNGDKDKMDIKQYLENLYKESLEIVDINSLELDEDQLTNINNIVSKEETFKGVYTVLLTSLVYKSIFPNQDIRYHQANMQNGYSGRSFDTKYITPFLKSKRFAAAMKESGWLTRSLEQNIPYTLDYPGKINSRVVKKSFLHILNDIQTSKNNNLSKSYIIALFKKSIDEKAKRAVVLINPIKKESVYTIQEIIDLLNKHFYFKYKSRGASILPVVALYSIYECIIDELKRFNGKKLQNLASHNSSDRSSGATGDIVVFDEKSNDIYESVEVKFDIPVSELMVFDAYKKFANTKIQRYYILSTESMVDSEVEAIHNLVQKIKEEHGCQVIINGVFPT